MEFISIILLVCGLIVLLLAGIPVGFALGLAGIASILTVGAQFLMQVPITLLKSLSDPVLIAIPLFVLMGEILYQGKVGQNLFEVANAWLGRIRGGTGVSAVFAYTFFAAIVGSSMASVLTIGKVAIPAMEQEGYSKRITYGLTAVGGSLGILIPPSLPLLIYSTFTNASPNQLFIAGFLPGFMIAAMLAIWAGLAAPPHTRGAPYNLKKAVLITLKAVPDLLLPVIVLGGIYAGIYTPTEAAAIGVVYAFFITVILRRTLRLSDFPSIFVETLKSNAMLLTIVLGALLFGSALTLIGLPQILAELLTDAQLSPTSLLIIFFIIWLIMGYFLEVLSVMLISLPIFFPIARSAGIDPVWFGIFMVICMEIAVITPPVGMNLFAIKSLLPNESLTTITRAALPSVLILIAAIVLLWLFPEIALYLVR